MKEGRIVALKIVLTIAAFIVSFVLGATAQIVVGGQGTSMGIMTTTVSLASLIIPIWRSSRMKWRVMSALFAVVAGMLTGTLSLFLSELYFRSGTIDMSTAVTIYATGATAAH